MRKAVFTVAGSDPSGGAGIQQDIKVFTCLKLYACAAVTALTVQNTQGVKSVNPVDSHLLEAQVRAVLEDINISGIKIGMLSTEENVAALSRVLALKNRAWVVADPVMRSKNNRVLLEDGAWKVYEELLFPHVDILTPNVNEAEVISSFSIDSVEKMKEAARVIQKKMTRKRMSIHEPGVYLKGGHLVKGKEVVDIFCHRGKIITLKAPRIENIHTHGTGCTFSSALCGYLVIGKDPEEAAFKAKAFVSSAIKAGFGLGRGTGPVDPLIFLK